MTRAVTSALAQYAPRHRPTAGEIAAAAAAAEEWFDTGLTLPRYCPAWHFCFRVSDSLQGWSSTASRYGTTMRSLEEHYELSFAKAGASHPQLMFFLQVAMTANACVAP